MISLTGIHICIYILKFFSYLFDFYCCNYNCCDYVKYIVNECCTDMFFQCMLYKLMISQNNIFKSSNNNNI